MSETVKLRASDGHSLNAYVAEPSGTPRAGLVVIQEIFGVNAHIRSVADSYAQHGFLAVAPAIFDRIEKDVDLSYEGDDPKKAFGLMHRVKMDDAVKDVDAALQYAAERSGKPVFVVGYCFGGTLAWLSATRLHPAAAVGYYGGMIAKFVAEKPRVPVMLHFGQDDDHISAEDVAKIQSAHPEVQIFTYPGAAHAFNRNVGPSYRPEQAKQALERTLAFFKNHGA